MDVYNKKDITKIINRILKKEIFIIPSDTIYGISTSIYTKNAKMKINKIKKRSKNKEIIVLVSSIKEAKKMANLSKNDILILKRQYPTTIISKINENFKFNNSNFIDNKTIAIRIVKNLFIKKILKKTGPIFSTSANLSGQDYITSLEIFKNFKVDFILFDEIETKNESTIYNSTIQKFIRKSPNDNKK